MDTLMLNLLYGIPAIPGDGNSAEQGMDRIALASEDGSSGFFMDETRPFMPKIASLKGGGVWIDSTADDGRTLQNDSVGNVSETIYLELAGNFATKYRYLAQLNRFADQAREFHTTHYQTRPVQLEWWATGAPGPQYALVYDIAIDVQRASYDMATTFQIIITLEREPAWRGIPFGWPATVWTQYTRGVAPGAWDLADLSLISGDALIQETVDNKHEFSESGSATDQNTILSKNYIDIPSGVIPGDAPALISVGILTSSLALGETSMGLRYLIMARSTKPTQWEVPDGETRPQFYTLNAGDASTTAGTKTVTANTAEGVVSYASNAGVDLLYYWLQTAAASEQVLSWGVGGAEFQLSREAFRGKFAVFVRGRGDATNPASYRIEIHSATGISDSVIVIDDIIPSIAVTGVNYTHYLGVLTIPLDSRSWVGFDGQGLSVYGFDDASDGDLTIKLFVTTATATQSTRVTDLILMPYDEAQLMILPNFIVETGQARVMYDNTGYLNRDVGDFAPVGSSRSQLFNELIGNMITLQPDTNNRLYLLLTREEEGGTTFRSAVEVTMTTRVNIIPRWYGVRDA